MIDLEKIELATSVDLGLTVKDKDVYHFVYGSQLYGTLFGVYAKFSTEIKTSNDGRDGYCIIKGIELHMLNYQGVLNVGFLDGPLVVKADSVKRRLDIFFNVQGGGVLLKTPPYDLATPIILNRGDRYTFIFNRIVFPIGATITQTVGANANPTMRIPTGIADSPYFDTEFEYRNGIDHFPNLLRPGMFGYEEANEVTKQAYESDSIDEKFMPSGRCHSSTVNMIF